MKVPRTNRVRRMREAIALALAATSSACGMGFDPASFVERPRLVGARVVVEGEPSRAWPLPGERVRVEPWLVQPERPESVGASYLACPAADVRRGPGGCAGEPIALVPSIEPSTSLPPFELTVPGRDVLGLVRELLVIVVTCERGARPVASSDSRLPRCDDPGARAEVSTLNVPIAFEPTFANRHPSLDDETFTIAGRVWTTGLEDAESDRGCVEQSGGSAMPRLEVAATSQQAEPEELEITFTTSADDRESFDGAAGPMREILQISHYATVGRLGRTFSVVDGDDASEPIRLGWTPPAPDTIPPEGRLVRFTWVARDLRGGFARAERVACIVAAGYER